MSNTSGLCETESKKKAAFPIRELKENDTRLIVIYTIEFSIVIGVISDNIQQKKLMLGDNADYITLKSIWYERNKSKAEVYRELHKFLNGISITSIDIYTENAIEIASDIIKLLSNYNEYFGKNQISMNDTAVFMNNSGLFTLYSEDRLEYICENISSGYIEGNLEEENTDIICYDDGHKEMRIQEITYNNVPHSGIKCYDRFCDTTEYELIALALRSVYAVEKEFEFNTNEVYTGRLITTTHNYVYNGIEHQLEADLGYIAEYGLGLSCNINKKSFKISRKSIEGLIKAYAEEYFKQIELDDISRVNQTTAEGENIEPADYIEYYNGAEPLADDDSLPNLYIYGAQLKLILEIIKDFYNKGIYMSFDLRRLEEDYEAETKQPVYKIKKSRFTRSIEINKFVTTNLRIDIDKEVEKAINKLKEAARKEFSKRKLEQQLILDKFSSWKVSEER